MNRRTVLTIAIAVIAAVLIGALWFIFFRSSGESAPQGGSFGTGTERPQPPGSQGSTGNIPTPIGTGQTIGTGGTGIGGSSSGGGTVSPPGGSFASGSTTPGFNYGTGGEWLSGGGTGFAFGGGSGSSFTPGQINELLTGNIGGTVTILGGYGAPDGWDDGLNLGLLGAGVAAVGCVAGPFLSQLGSSLFNTGASASTYATATAADALGVPVNTRGANLILTYQLGFNNTLKSSETVKENFLDCLTRTIARAAVQQITASVVNWINSGFQGKPSFVTNYKEFFASVGDQAAGEYIRGSALSFLCSPFQLKVRIAIAQSYAQRYSAPSCTLSGVIKNVESFASGNFSQGGWGGLIQFTTVPTNNPYGAFAYAQIGLATAQQSAVSMGQQDLSLGQGFLSFKQKTGCTTTTGANGQPTQTCSGPDRIVTPGRVIADSLGATQKSSLDSLNLAKSFDEIISALVQQLMVRTLYQGLGNLSSGPNGYESNFLTPDQIEAQKKANEFLTTLQGLVTLSQQFGQVQQGSIADIQNVQQKISQVVDCWNIHATSSGLSEQQRQVAKSNAYAAETWLHSFDSKIAVHNGEITRANTAITLLQDLQTRTLTVTSTEGVNALASELAALQAAGKLVTQNDVTQAQQDRTSLQTTLATDSTNASQQLAQCNAFLN